MYKQANLSFSVAAQSFGDDVTSIQFSTQDKNTAKLVFVIKEGKQPLDLTDVEGVVDLVMGDKSVFDDNKATVTAPLDGKLEYTLTPEQIRHSGRAKGELQLVSKDGQSIGGFRFNFTIKPALVDEYSGAVKEFYIQDLEAVKQEVQKKADTTLSDIDKIKAQIEETAESIKDIDVVRIDTELKTKVSKVNGKAPDSSGNVTIPVSEVDTTNLATKTELSTVTAALEDTSQQLETAMKYPVLDIEKNKVIRKNLPYGHVERYGADPTGVNDSTVAIQTAVDVMEELAKGITVYSSGFFKVQFGSGNYKITKTIRLKYDSTKHSTSSPITIVGNERKRVADQLGKGTVIRPLIPNHTGKSYANAFSINIKYNNVDDEDDTIAFDTEPLQTVNSVMFKHLTFTLTEEESEIYNICAIKGYRFRIDTHKLCFTNLWRGVWQPEKDRMNKYSYCDFSTYDDLSFTGMKLSCLDLYVPDASTIKRIYNHKPKATFDHIIKITKGASIRIETIHHAMHGTFVDGSLVPRNDGSGQTGTKGLIKIIEASTSISGVYAERSLVDYVLHLTNVTSLKFDTYEGKFFGNGFLSINGANNHNIIIENVKRNENIVSEYLDFYIASGAAFSGLKIKNYIPRQYYSDNISLNTPLTNLVPNTDSSFITRDIKHNFTGRQYRHIESETIVFKVYYDGTAWQSRDIYGNDMSNALGSFVWLSDRLSFSGSKLTYCKLLSIEPAYISGNQLPHIPIRRGDNLEGIRFYDRATGQAISTPDTKCSVMVTVMCVLNMTKLP